MPPVSGSTLSICQMWPFFITDLLTKWHLLLLDGHITAVSHALLQVVDAINQLATQYIKFPNIAEEQVTVKMGFNSIAGPPNTINVIDCTHVRVKAPSPDLFPYLNRKQYHSTNVQLICNSQNHLMNTVSRFPGGAHNSFILQNSSMGIYLEQGAAHNAQFIGTYLLIIRMLYNGDFL